MKRYRTLLMRLGIWLGSLLLLYQIIQGVRAVQDKTLVLSQPGFILLALGFLVYSIFQQMVAWRVMMASIGVSIPIRQVLHGYILSFLPRYIPGSIWGYLSRAQWLYQDHQIPYPLSNLGSLLEVGISFAANLLMIVLYLAVQANGLPRWGLLLLFALVLPLSWFLLRHIGRFTWFCRVIAKGADLRPLASLDFWKWCQSCSLITINWFFYGAATMMVATGFGFQQGAFSMAAWLAYSTLYSLAWLVGFLVIFIPSGLGLREVVLSNLLAATFGFSYSQASALAVIMRLIVAGAEVTWIGIALKLKFGGSRGRQAAGETPIHPGND